LIVKGLWEVPRPQIASLLRFDGSCGFGSPRLAAAPNSWIELLEADWSMVFVCNAYVDIDAAHGVVLECWVGFRLSGEIVL
jgi:hypothetical protein